MTAIANPAAQPVETMTREEARAFMEQIEEEAKIEYKLSYCGAWYCYPAPTSGNLVRTKHYCNDYRHCPTCNKRKVSEIMTELRSVEDPLYTRTILEEDWKTVSHRWRRKGIQWRQFPMVLNRVRYCIVNAREEDDNAQPLTDFFFFPSPPDTGPNDPGSTLIPNRLTDILKTMPKDRRQGGKLGRRPRAAPQNSDPVRVEVLDFNASKEKSKEAWDEAVEDTIHLDPSTAAEAEAACQERSEAFKRRLRSKGITRIHSHFETRYVRSGTIQWRGKQATERTRLSRGSLGWYKSRVPIGMFPPIDVPERAEISP